MIRMPIRPIATATMISMRLMPSCRVLMADSIVRTVDLRDRFVPADRRIGAGGLPAHRDRHLAVVHPADSERRSVPAGRVRQAALPARQPGVAAQRGGGGGG